MSLFTVQTILKLDLGHNNQECKSTQGEIRYFAGGKGRVDLK